MYHLSAKLWENQVSSFYITLLTNKQINPDKNITSLAEVTKTTIILWPPFQDNLDEPVSEMIQQFPNPRSLRKN